MPVLIGCLNEYLDKWALKTKNAVKEKEWLVNAELQVFQNKDGKK